MIKHNEKCLLYRFANSQNCSEKETYFFKYKLLENSYTEKKTVRFSIQRYYFLKTFKYGI